MNDQLLDQPPAADVLGRVSAPAPWEVLWNRKSYVVLGAVIGLVLGVLYWSMAKRVYESSAQIWVVKKQPDSPITSESPMGSGGTYLNTAEDFLGTHRTLIRSAVVLGDAVAKGRLNERAAFSASSRPAHDLSLGLTVTRDRDKSGGGNSNSQVLNISFRCNKPEDCAPVLSAVLDSYRGFLDNRTQDSSKQTLDLIDKAQRILKDDLEKKEKERDDFLRKAPHVWKTAYGTTLYQERLGNLDAQRTSLLVRHVRLRATLEEVEAALKQGCSQTDLLEILSASSAQETTMIGGRMQKGMVVGSGGGSAGPLSSSLEQELITLQLELGRLLEDYGPKHPRVKSVRDRLQTVRAMLAPSAPSATQTAEQQEREVRAKERLVELKLSKLKQELAECERSKKSLDALYEVELREAKKAFPYETQLASYQNTIDRSQRLFNNINQSLQSLNVVSNSRGFETQLITPPTEPEKVSPRGSMILPLSLFLGFLFGGGLAYLVELTDKSFRSPEDVRRRLDLPIMGVIPLVKTNAKTAAKKGEGDLRLSPTLFAWHRPKSREAEAYRAVRTALYFSTHGQGRKLIQVTSPSQGDGKSTLAANLAVSIAQSGKTVLLVDADLRRPQADKLFGEMKSLGFAAVLGGLTEPSEAICATGVPGLSLIPAGATPPNPAELLTGPRLREVLEWLRERYEYVIVDTPPLLAVTDPGIVAPQVDGVIMTLRSTKKARVEAKRAKEVLTNLGVNIFGLVLNALDQTRNADSSGYYYGYGYYGQAYYKEDNEGAEQSDEIQPARVERIENAGANHQGNGKPFAGT